jgi:hypothetical protein
MLLNLLIARAPRSLRALDPGAAECGDNVGPLSFVDEVFIE